MGWKWLARSTTGAPPSPLAYPLHSNPCYSDFVTHKPFLKHSRLHPCVAVVGYHYPNCSFLYPPPPHPHFSAYPSCTITHPLLSSWVKLDMPYVTNYGVRSSPKIFPSNFGKQQHPLSMFIFLVGKDYRWMW